MLERKAAQLFGRQQPTRGAGRALVRKPDVLLLDERWPNLDASSGWRCRSEIRRVQLETGTRDPRHPWTSRGDEHVRPDRPDEGRRDRSRSPNLQRCLWTNPADRYVAGVLGNPPIAFLRLPGRTTFSAPCGSVRPRRGRDVAGAFGPIRLGVQARTLRPRQGRCRSTAGHHAGNTWARRPLRGRTGPAAAACGRSWPARARASGPDTTVGIGGST